MLILDKLFAPIYLRLNNMHAQSNADHVTLSQQIAALEAKLDGLAEGQKVLSDMIKSPVKRKVKK